MTDRLSGARTPQRKRVLRLMDANPAIFGRLPRFHFARVDPIVPAVQFQVPGLELVLHLGVRAKPVELQAYVELGQIGESLREGWASWALPRAWRASLACRSQLLTWGMPASDAGFRSAFMAPQSEWPHTTTSLTPRAETAYSMVAETSSPRLKRGDHVSRVPANEEIARTALRNPLQRHARVRTGDKERFGLLAGGESRKQFPVGRKHVSLKLLNSLNDSVHVYPLDRGGCMVTRTRGR